MEMDREAYGRTETCKSVHDLIVQHIPVYVHTCSCLYACLHVFMHLYPYKQHAYIHTDITYMYDASVRWYAHEYASVCMFDKLPAGPALSVAMAAGLPETCSCTMQAWAVWGHDAKT